MVGKIFMLDDNRLILQFGQFEIRRVNNMIINVLLKFMLSVQHKVQ